MPSAFPAHSLVKIDSLLVGQVRKCMPLALALHIGVRPAVLRLECHQRLLAPRIHPQVDRSNRQRDNETAGEEDKDGDFARDIVGRVLGEEDFRADNVASAEGEEGHRVHCTLLGVTAGVTGVVGVDSCQGATVGAREVYT